VEPEERGAETGKDTIRIGCFAHTQRDGSRLGPPHLEAYGLTYTEMTGPLILLIFLGTRRSIQLVWWVMVGKDESLDATQVFIADMEAW
jgi:hypothetical protein